MWRAHGPQLRQCADTGKRLIYSRHYCSVSAEGDAAVTVLSPDEWRMEQTCEA